jgi:O-antigen/teichoic acid export membrane protein
MTDAEAAIVEAEALGVAKAQPGLRRYFAGAGVIAASEIFSRVKGLVLIPLLTRHLGTINYGVWSQVLILATFVPLLMIMGTDSAIVRYLPGHDAEYQRRHFSGWLLTMLGIGAVLCGLLVAARGPVSDVFFGGGQEYERFVPLAAGTIYVNVLITGIRGWFRLRASTRGWATVTAGQAVTSLIATILLLSLNRTIYQYVIYSIVLDSTLSLLLLIWIWRTDGISRPVFGLLPKMIRFGLPLVPAGFAVWGLNWLDRIFLVNYTDLSAVGRYSLAYSLGYLAIQVVANPIWTMYPTAAAEHWNQGDHEGVQRYFEQTAGAMLLLVAPIIAFTAVAGRPILEILAPPSFASAAPVIAIVMAGYLLTLLSAYYETAMGLVHKQWLSTVATVIAFLSNLALNFILIPSFGIIGAGVATGAAFAIQLVFSMAVMGRLGVLRTEAGGPVRILLASVGATVAMLVASTAFDGGAFAELCVIGAVGALSYFGLVMLLRLVPAAGLRSELSLVYQGLRRGG